MLAVDKYVQIIIFTAKLFNLFIFLRLENSITFYKIYCRKQTLSTSLFIRLAALMPVVTNNHRLGSFYCTPFEYYYREIFSLPFLSYYH